MIIPFDVYDILIYKLYFNDMSLKMLKNYWSNILVSVFKDNTHLANSYYNLFLINI